MMTAMLPQQRLVLAIATSVVGTAASWLTETPFGLLAAVAAVFLFARGRAVPLLYLALAIAFAGSVAATSLYGGGMRDLAVSWAAFSAVALCIGAIITSNASGALGDDALQAMRIIESMPAHTWSSSPDGRLTHVSASFLSYAGEAPDKAGLFLDLDNAGWRRVVHPDDYARVLERRRHSLATGQPYDTEFRIRGRDGTYRWFRCFGSASRDDHGQVVGWYGTMTDIEEQKRAGDALRRSERQLQQMIDAVPALIWCTTPEGTPSYINKRLMDAIGVTLADLITPDAARSLADVHPDHQSEVEQALTHSIATGAPFAMTYRQRRADGSYRWTEGRAEALRDESGDVVQWYGVCVDIEDLMTAQAALCERERELSQLVDMVPSHVWRLTADGEPVFFNKRMVDYLGLDVADTVKPGMTRLEAVIETVHPDDATQFRDTLNHSLATGESFALRYRLRRADGVYRWMSSRAEPLRAQTGNIVQWYGLCHDIDDQVRIEEELRERERSLRQLVETLPAMIDCAAPDGEPIYRSQQLREFLGYNLEDLDGTGKPRLAGTLDAGVHPDDLAGVKERYAHSLSTGEPYARRHRLRRFDGEYRWVETRAAPMRDTEGAIVQWNVICLDIDGEVRAQEELRLAQERLSRASQAASLAELSASIAHEVNQPLAAIVANSHACHRWLSVEPANVERAKITAERMIRDANSAADVVSRIRALFKRSVETRESMSYADVIAEVRDLLVGEAARRRIRINIEVARDLPPVALDRIQVQQVLVNLVRNGLEAMDSDTDDMVLRVRVHRTGDAVRTEISDHGPGIEFPDRIFEPFFTTKDRGMGMGLAICRSIVESHGGRLWAERNEPRGATFVFTLPVEAKAAS